MFAVIRRKQEPEIKIGPHCSDPYACPLQEQCWAFLPENSVLNLYYGGKKCWRLFGDGIIRLRDITGDVNLTARQAIQRTVALTGQPQIDCNALSSFLKRLKYPLSYLDFDDLEIRVGGQASLEFLRVHYGPASDAEREKVRRNLERYCGQDTEAMFWIMDELRRLCQ